MLDYINIISCLLGVAAHALRCLDTDKSRGRAAADYLWHRRYKAGLSLVGAAAGYIALAELGQLGALTAFGVGYLADDALEMLTTKAKRALQSAD